MERTATMLEEWSKLALSSEDCDKWAWVLFELETEIRPPTDIIVKVVDSAASSIGNEIAQIGSDIV